MLLSVGPAGRRREESLRRSRAVHQAAQGHLRSRRGEGLPGSESAEICRVAGIYQISVSAFKRVVVHFDLS